MKSKGEPSPLWVLSAPRQNAEITLSRHTGPRAGIFLTAWLPEILLLCEQDCSGDPGYFLRKFRDDSGFRDDNIFSVIPATEPVSP